MSHRPVSMIAAASTLSLLLAACSGNSDTAVNDAMSDSASGTAMAGEDPMGVDTTMGSEGAMAGGSMLAANSPGAKFLTEAMMGDNSEVKIWTIGHSAGIEPGGEGIRQDAGQ